MILPSQTNCEKLSTRLVVAASLNNVVLRSSIMMFQVGFSEMIRAMQTVTPSCGEMMTHCSWNGRSVACSEIFDVRRTDSGFCCSFNTLNPAENFDLSDVDVLSIPTTPAAVAAAAGASLAQQKVPTTATSTIATTTAIDPSNMQR